MTDNTQSLLDKAMHRIEDHLRRANNCRCSSRFLLGEYKSRLFLAEYEANKANHFEDMRGMVKARQCDAVPAREATVWQYREIIYGDEALWWEECSKSDYEELSLEPDVYETRALGVIDQGAA